MLLTIAVSLGYFRCTFQLLKNITALKLGNSTNVGLIIFLVTLIVKPEKGKRDPFQTLFIFIFIFIIFFFFTIYYQVSGHQL